MHLGRRFRVGLAAVVLPALAGCWWSPSGGPNRSGHNPGETAIGVDTVATLAETAVLADVGGASGPVVSGSRLYTAGGGRLWAFDAATGTEIWRNPEDPTSDAFRVDVDGGELLVTGGSGRLGYTLTRMDARTGQSLGPSPTRVDAFGTIRGSTLAGQSFPDNFAPVLVHSLVVGDPDDAARNWRAFLLVGESVPWATDPTIGAEHVFVTGRGLLSTDPTATAVGPSVRAYALAGGHTACATAGEPPYDVTYTCPDWSVPIDGTSSTTPVLSDDLATVFVGTDAGTVYAIEAATGAVRWTAAVGSAVTALPAVADGMVLVPTASSGLVALPADGCGAATCAPVWTASTGASIDEQPVVAGGAVFTLSAGGLLDAYAVAGCGATTCAALWSDDLVASITQPMAVEDGRLFVTVDGDIHVYAPAG